MPSGYLFRYRRGMRFYRVHVLHPTAPPAPAPCKRPKVTKYDSTSGLTRKVCSRLVELQWFMSFRCKWQHTWDTSCCERLPGKPDASSVRKLHMMVPGAFFLHLPCLDIRSCSAFGEKTQNYGFLAILDLPQLYELVCIN